MEGNPFLEIHPKKEEKLFGITPGLIKEYVKKLTVPGTIVILSGGFGAGKSVVALKIEKELKKINKVKLICSPDLVQGLMNTKKKGKTVVFVEKFYLCLALGERSIKRIIDTIGEMAGKGFSFLITATPELAATIPQLSDKLKGVVSFELPPLSLEDAKRLISARLGGKLDPFTEDEVRHVWRTSNGNPKMILLLCASLYDAKAAR
jgi:hypothetical protein